MKKAFCLLLSLLMLFGFSSCSKPAEMTPLERRTEADVYFSVFSLNRVALGNDGKLFIGGIEYESNSSMAEITSIPELTERQRSELPTEIAEVIGDGNDITGMYNWHFVAENVVDFWQPGPYYYLTSDGKLFSIRDDSNGEPSKVGESLLIAENVAKLCHTWPMSFIKENGDWFVIDQYNVFYTIEGAEPAVGLSGQKLAKVASNVREASFEIFDFNWSYVDAWGQMWVCGINDFGLLGNGTYDEARTPEYRAKDEAGTPVEPEGYSRRKFYKVLDHVKKPYVFGKQVFALRDDGSLWGWGANEFGSVGAGKHGEGDANTRDIIAKPTKILDHVVKLDQVEALRTDSADGDFVAIMALTEDGKLYSWGDNMAGNLANGESAEGKSISAYSLIEEGLFADRPTLVMTDVQDFSINRVLRTTFLALKTNGDVYAWGNSEYGGVGNGVKRTDVSRGGNTEGLFVTTPVKILENVLELSAMGTIGAIQKDGTVLNWGDNPFGWEMTTSAYSNTDSRNIFYRSIFATPTVNPYISAIVGEDGSVSFVPTPVE